MRYRRRCCIFLLLVAFAAIGNVRKDSCTFQCTESGLDTSPDPGLIYIVNGMRLTAAVDALVIRDGVISMDSHQLYQLNGTDGRTDDYWKAELGAAVTVTGLAFAILVALAVCQSEVYGLMMSV